MKINDQTTKKLYNKKMAFTFLYQAHCVDLNI